MNRIVSSPLARSVWTASRISRETASDPVRRDARGDLLELAAAERHRLDRARGDLDDAGLDAEGAAVERARALDAAAERRRDLEERHEEEGAAHDAARGLVAREAADDERRDGEREPRDRGERGARELAPVAHRPFAQSSQLARNSRYSRSESPSPRAGRSFVPFSSSTRSAVASTSPKAAILRSTVAAWSGWRSR